MHTFLRIKIIIIILITLGSKDPNG